MIVISQCKSIEKTRGNRVLSEIAFESGTLIRMALAPNESATDSNSLELLLNPDCGIPFDIHFDIQDEAGTTLGTFGCHKNILALKSPVFKAMLFGSLRETSDHIKIKATSKKAFKTMLLHVYGVDEEWLPWSLDIRDMFLTTDLAQRYNLAGLHQKIVKHAGKFFIPKERLVEIAHIVESFQVYTEMAVAVGTTCAIVLLAILETPEHFNDFVSEWSGKSSEEASTAFGLLASIDHSDLAYANTSLQTNQVISHLRNIRVAIKPRQRLQCLKDMIEAAEGASKQDILDTINYHDHDHEDNVFQRSFWACQRLDEERASDEGIPLTLDTHVEDHFTHEASVKLHLDIIRMALLDHQVYERDIVTFLWKEMLRSIPEVKSIMFHWLSNNSEILDTPGKFLLAVNLRSCDVAMKQLPGYEDARRTYEHYE